jgi:hypothetical protein
MTPAVTQLLERAKAEGSLRPDARLLDVPYIVLATDAVALASPGSDAWRRYLAIALDGLGTAGSRLPADESGMDAVDDAFSTWGAYRP